MNRVQGSVPLEAGEWTIFVKAKNTEGWAVDVVNAVGHVIKLPNGKITISYPRLERVRYALFLS